MDTDFDDGSGLRWYVASTLPRKERLAEFNLRNQDIRSFLPLLEVTRRHARKVRTELAAAFSGYIFVNLDIGRQRWRSVNGTIGVAHLLCDGEGPRAVESGVVETLIHSVDSRGAIVFEPSLAVGDSVRLLSGPFADSLGVLQRLDGAGRVQLLLDLISGPVKVNVSRDRVIAAG
jgi:transcription antitermination factor NusG